MRGRNQLFPWRRTSPSPRRLPCNALRRRTYLRHRPAVLLPTDARPRRPRCKSKPDRHYPTIHPLSGPPRPTSRPGLAPSHWVRGVKAFAIWVQEPDTPERILTMRAPLGDRPGYLEFIPCFTAEEQSKSFARRKPGYHSIPVDVNLP